jgi:hypothetical protein
MSGLFSIIGAFDGIETITIPGDNTRTSYSKEKA